MEFLEKLLNHSGEGYITIDGEGIVRICNPKAQSIFGLGSSARRGHRGGRLETGDFIVIADNSMGYDDGNLAATDLKGMSDRTPPVFGEGFIFMGESGASDGQMHVGSGRLVQRASHAGRLVEARVDPIRRELVITVDDETFPIRYIYSFGHMLILDAEGRIKFWQDHGYTARGESIREILGGKPFLGKGPDEQLTVIGKPLDAVLEGQIAQTVLEVARDERPEQHHQSYTINGKPVICDIFRIDGGACLRLEDVSEYESLMRSKEQIIRQLRAPLNGEGRRVIDFFGESTGIRRVRSLAMRAAGSRSTVVLLGESGTGKSLLARQIHDEGNVYRKAFIEVNCSAIPENLFESEFFGYERGAFTGAQQQGKKGYFELADGGTLFLDEVAELTPSGQTKLLNVIQNKRFYRVGGTREVQVDFRLIVATNQDLQKAVEAGRFREDLYFRLQVFPILIPPLRERKEDIPLLIDAIIPEIRKKTGREGFSLSPDAVIQLTAQSWPGNVREMENVLERLANLLDHDLVLDTDLEFLEAADTKGLELKAWVEDLERNLIERALSLSGGDKKLAMQWLRIKKSAFYEKLKKYGID